MRTRTRTRTRTELSPPLFKRAMLTPPPHSTPLHLTPPHPTSPHPTSPHPTSPPQRLKNTLTNRELELTDAKSKLNESSKLLDSNQQVITWLNREINEAQLGKINSYSSVGGAAAATQKAPTNFNPSFSPDLKISHGLGAYISPEGGATYGV